MICSTAELSGPTDISAIAQGTTLASARLTMDFVSGSTARGAYFFYGYEGFRWKKPVVQSVTLPTAAQRAGDFTQTRKMLLAK